MNGDKQVVDTNISPLAQKVLISDQMKTHCDQRANMAAFRQRLLNFLCCRPSLPLQNCSSVVTNNDTGVCAACLQFYAPLVFVLPSEEDDTPSTDGRQETSNLDIHNPTVKTPTVLYINWNRTNQFSHKVYFFPNVGNILLDFCVSSFNSAFWHVIIQLPSSQRIK